MVPSGVTENGNLFSFPIAGTYKITETATDNLFGSASNTVTVVVNPDILVSSTTVKIDLGQSVILSATVSGGSGMGYMYNWYQGSSCTGVPLISTKVAPTTNTTYCVQITDSLGGTKTATETVIVNPHLSILLSPSYVVVDDGQNVTLTNTTKGGTAPYTYSYNASDYDTGCRLLNRILDHIYSKLGVQIGVTRDGNKFSFQNNGATPEVYKITETATDSLSVSASNSMIVKVNPQIQVMTSFAVIDQGQSVTLSATAFGGSNSGFTYTWYQGSACTGTPLTSAKVSPTSTTTYCVIAKDSLGGTGTAIETVTVQPPVKIKVPPCPKMHKGDSWTFTNSTSGGTWPYQYKYDVPDGVKQRGNTFTFPCSGTYVIKETVTDALTQSTNSTAITVTVDSK